MFNIIKETKKDGLFGFFISTTLWFCIAMLTFFIIKSTESLWKPVLFFTKHYPVEINVTITNKNHYTTKTTTLMKSGDVLIPVVNTHHHYDVSMKTDSSVITVNHQGLYSSTNINNKEVLTYQEEHWKWFWESDSHYSFNKNVNYKFK